ncbi:hypothetical protein HMPREF9248_0541 [Fannyhessea vaginae PB189-T1-4]|uniref:Uncharacterized protein n=1 Tax=Fannyhessea vaginae PB189-T1-4 TaxID=866774 RepID=A0ABP2IXV0_9ACTN|nr:hypothetical protein HMPREF9248_0541 [Fannyhessea vaginae PB189-T1-4]
MRFLQNGALIAFQSSCIGDEKTELDARKQASESCFDVEFRV